MTFQLGAQVFFALGIFIGILLDDRETRALCMIGVVTVFG